MQRQYDLVLIGGTGFTGGLTAEYLARTVPPDLRWALAGRDPGRLRALRDRLTAVNPACAALDLRTADTGDPAAMDELAAATRLVATTVGPYTAHGGPLVAACARAGTDYTDLAGEPRFVDETYARHHATALRTGARLVHSCGFESVPADLGALYTVHRLPEGAELHIDAFVRLSGAASAGTVHSAADALATVPAMLRARRRRRALEPRPAGRRVRTGAPPVPRTRLTRGWALPLPTIDHRVVHRSAAALERYGPDFGYGHHLAVRRFGTALATAAGGAGMLAATQVPALRERLLRRWAPGDGPDAATRAASWFTVRFVGTGGGRRVVTEVGGGDPGYSATAVMLAESALCLLRDELPATAGQTTTAVAMGTALIDRLDRAGITFRTLDTSG